MARLIQLPNGDWLAKEKIISVTYHPTRDHDPGPLPPDVTVRLDNGVTSIVPFQTDSEARSFRDQLASRVNNGNHFYSDPSHGAANPIE